MLQMVDNCKALNLLVLEIGFTLYGWFEMWILIVNQIEMCAQYFVLIGYNYECLNKRKGKWLSEMLEDQVKGLVEKWASKMLED